MISGILLAAGSSYRMGKDNKLLLSLEGSPLFTKSLKALEESEVGEIIVVLGHDYQSLLPHFNDSSIRLAINGNHLEGQTTSIQTGLRMVNPSANGFIICLADMPLVTSKHLNELIHTFHSISGKRIILRPFKDDIPGNPVLFSKAFIGELLTCEVKNGGNSVIKANEHYLHKFMTEDWAYFRDVDTPEDYHKFKLTE